MGFQSRKSRCLREVLFDDLNSGGSMKKKTRVQWWQPVWRGPELYFWNVLNFVTFRKQSSALAFLDPNLPSERLLQMARPVTSLQKALSRFFHANLPVFESLQGNGGMHLLHFWHLQPTSACLRTEQTQGEKMQLAVNGCFMQKYDVRFDTQVESQKRAKQQMHIS